MPVWCYYNNRGQGVCSFGVNGKDHAIMEFSLARQACRDVARAGFRTFCKVNGTYRELFTQNRDMHIGMSELEITYVQDGLRASAVYFGVPGERTAALARVLTEANAGAQPITLELLDGMPELIPYGVGHENLKEMNNLAQAWMRVEDGSQGTAYFRVRASMEDTAQVGRVEGCNFCLAWDEGAPLSPAAPTTRCLTPPAVRIYLNHALRGGVPVFFEDGGKTVPIKAMMGRSAKVTENERTRKQRELDGLFERLYEDNVSQKIGDARFAKMSQRYEQEQGENDKRIPKRCW